MSQTRTKPKSARPKVPAYARYQGTSAWRGDRRRVRAYAWYRANEAKKAAAAAPGSSATE